MTLDEAIAAAGVDPLIVDGSRDTGDGWNFTTETGQKWHVPNDGAPQLLVGVAQAPVVAAPPEPLEEFIDEFSFEALPPLEETPAVNDASFSGEVPVGVTVADNSTANASDGDAAIEITERPDHFETFKGKDGQFYFRRVAANGEKVHPSEGYRRLKDATAEAHREADPQGLEVRRVDA